METKRFLFGIIGGLALASCSNDDVVSVNHDGDEIAFNVVTNAVTRADSVYCNNNKPKQFTVSATHNNQQYIDKDVIAYIGDKWVNTSGIRYWPEGEVTFFAHANAGDAFDYNGGSPEIENFTIGNDVAKQVDLIYAKQTKTKPTDDGPVTLNFRHALSQIVFQAKNTNPNLYVEISEVSVCNVKSKGTFTYPTGSSTDRNIEEHRGNGTIFSYDDSWGNWDVSAPTTYSVTLNSAVGVPGDGNVKPLTSTNDRPTDNELKEYSSNAMLLLPQTSDAWNVAQKPGDEDQNGTYFLVKCRIFNVAGDNWNNDDVCLWGGTNGENIAIPVSLNWEQGKKYIYTFVFGEGNGGYDPKPDVPTPPEPVLLPITFNVTVDDFGSNTKEDIPMDEPANQSETQG